MMNYTAIETIKTIGNMKNVSREIVVSTIKEFKKLDLVIPAEQRAARPVSTKKAEDYKSLLVNYGLFDTNFIVVIADDGSMLLIDGAHRKRFLDKLEDTYFNYNGKILKFAELPLKKRVEILNMKVAITFYKNVPVDVAFQYYNGGNPANTMERLHSTYHSCKAWNTAKHLAEYASVKELLGGKVAQEDEGYSATHTMLQTTGLIYNYLLQKECDPTNILFTAKSKAFNMVFDKDNEKFMTRTMEKKLEYLYDCINENQYLSIFDKPGKKRRKCNMTISNFAFVAFRIIDETATSSKFSDFKVAAKKIFNVDYKQDLKAKLKDMNYDQYFDNGKNAHQIPELYAAMMATL